MRNHKVKTGRLFRPSKSPSININMDILTFRIRNKGKLDTAVTSERKETSPVEVSFTHTIDGHIFATSIRERENIGMPGTTTSWTVVSALRYPCHQPGLLPRFPKGRVGRQSWLTRYRCPLPRRFLRFRPSPSPSPQPRHQPIPLPRSHPRPQSHPHLLLPLHSLRRILQIL